MRGPLGRSAVLAARLAGLLCLVGLALGAGLLLPVPPPPARPPTLQEVGREEARAAATGTLRAGAARVRLVVPEGGPIAGYPAPRRDRGGGEPLWVRAIALEVGGVRAYLASAPILLVSPDLEAEVMRRASLPPSACLLLGATHTHAGPGGFWDNLLAEAGGVGRFSGERRGAIAAAVAEALRQAEAALAPARATWAQLASPEPALSEARGPGPVDAGLTALRLDSASGSPIATLAVLGLHPTVIPRGVRSLSGDWPEAAARALEESSTAPTLVLQGAVGDATWIRRAAGGSPERPEQAVERIGRAVAAQVERLLDRSPQSPTGTGPAPVRLACEVRLLALPAPEAGRALAWPVRRAATNLLRRFAPAGAVTTRLELGDHSLLGVPGEPVGELGLRARAAGPVGAVLVGLADGYAGYVETEARARAGGGESARTWYGPGLAAALGLEPPSP